MRGPPPLGPIVGESLAIRRARELIERYAPSDLSILIVGPTGAGKELVARHIHARSKRPGRFVPVNCGALPREMAEGLLFGHDRGAFSGAVKRHRGHLQCADSGTLFLDELLSLPVEQQPKLLRALDTGEIQPLGEEAVRYVDTRVVAAVQPDVEDRIAQGQFRADLYRRVAGTVVELPPLADRPEDVTPLARHFAGQCGKSLEPGTPRALLEYAWPGNARELRQVIERAGRLVENGTLPASAVREAIASGGPHGAPRSEGPNAERETLLATCRSHAWNLTAAARTLRIARATLYRRLRREGLSAHEARALC